MKKKNVLLLGIIMTATLTCCSAKKEKESNGEEKQESTIVDQLDAIQTDTDNIKDNMIEHFTFVKDNGDTIGKLYVTFNDYGNINRMEVRANASNKILYFIDEKVFKNDVEVEFRPELRNFVGYNVNPENEYFIVNVANKKGTSVSDDIIVEWIETEGRFQIAWMP